VRGRRRMCVRHLIYGTCQAGATRGPARPARSPRPGLIARPSWFTVVVRHPAGAHAPTGPAPYRRALAGSVRPRPGGLWPLRRSV
ncbi:hypothetical protein, partial [Streptomyces laurentii]|uniref:hypothetical protein n=1 Tax=Streptomyces laurentii TaxID=39478 RepID=UPI003692F638